jgi:hypothetical protein
VEARRQVEPIVDQAVRERAPNALPSHLGQNIEVPDAPMKRRWVVFVLGLRSYGNQPAIRLHNPKARLRVAAIASVAPAFG